MLFLDYLILFYALSSIPFCALFYLFCLILLQAFQVGCVCIVI